VLAELLTNPALREQLQKAASPTPPPPAERAPEGGRGRLAALCSRDGDKLRSACRIGAGWLRQAVQAASLGWRLDGARVRALLLVAAAYLASTALAAAARRLYDGARFLASRAWGALRRALPGLGLCGT
jgi:hypothetical protein